MWNEWSKFHKFSTRSDDQETRQGVATLDPWQEKIVEVPQVEIREVVRKASSAFQVQASWGVNIF